MSWLGRVLRQVMARPRLVLATGSSCWLLLISWSLVHTAFAIHYAHEYYVERDDPGRRALEFPDLDPPDCVDFL